MIIYKYILYSHIQLINVYNYTVIPIPVRFILFVLTKVVAKLKSYYLFFSSLCFSLENSPEIAKKWEQNTRRTENKSHLSINCMIYRYNNETNRHKNWQGNINFSKILNFAKRLKFSLKYYSFSTIPFGAIQVLKLKYYAISMKGISVF